MAGRASGGTAERAVWRRVFRRGFVPSLVVAPQVPPVLAAGVLAGPWGLVALAPAVAFSAAFFTARDGYRFRPRGPLHLYLGLWPFFAWWASCLVFCALAPLALAAGALAGAAQAPVAAAGLVAAVSGLRSIWRTPRIVRLSLALSDLPPELDGYRIAQLSDIHCGPFAPEGRVRAWVRRANALEPDLAAVTGDLIASGADHVEAVAAALGELRARDGALACMGNHDYYGVDDELVEALRARGVRVLRNQSLHIARGPARILIAGVDDTWSRRADLSRALDGARDGELVVLLAHDPDVFPEAARRGVHLTLSGHTHGGQLAIPLLGRWLNLARLVTRYSSGLYRNGASLLYVNRGVGTSGPPIRIGTRAEIALITLRRAPAAGADTRSY